jgi:hypothetical protein
LGIRDSRWKSRFNNKGKATNKRDEKKTQEANTQGLPQKKGRKIEMEDVSALVVSSTSSC